MAPSETRWYVATGGQSHGPYAVEDIGGFMKDGKITSKTKVCPVGGNTWSRLSEALPDLVKEILGTAEMQLEEVPPPPPPPPDDEEVETKRDDTPISAPPAAVPTPAPNVQQNNPSSAPSHKTPSIYYMPPEKKPGSPAEKNCPKCDLVNPGNAARCDCGYDFSSSKMHRSYLNNSARITSAAKPQAPITAGWVLLFVTWALFIIPVPGLGLIGWVVNFAAFVMSIVAMVKGRVAAGVLIMIGSILASPIVYFFGWLVLAAVVSNQHPR